MVFKCSPKYFQRLKEAQAETPVTATVPPFDLQRMRSTGFLARVAGYFIEHPDWWLAVLRAVLPRARCGRFVLLTRNADVREVLERQADFETPYGPEMMEFAGGANFILGMSDGEEYRRLKSVVLSAFPPAEVEARVRSIAARRAREIVDGAGPSLNAAWDLFRPVSSAICRDYYGILVDDEGEFADWGIALSTVFFGDPTADKVVRELAIAASRNMRIAIDRSIDTVLSAGTLQERPLDRLVAAMQQDRIGRPDIHAIMMGMITGFGPTTLLGGGNCLEVALSRKEIFDEMAAAVAADDGKRLDHAIVEAMRFKPIWISPWRYARHEQKIGGEHGRPYTIKADTVIWPATRSAMFDRRAVPDPSDFRPNRPDQQSLVFGHGIHKCIGALLARVQTAECMRALFSKPGFHRAAGRQGRLQRLGPYPEKLMVAFDPADQQSMVTVIVPAKPGVPVAAIRAELDGLGNPCTGDARIGLDKTGVIHFASMSLIDTGAREDGTPGHHLVIEMSGDGDSKAVLAAFAQGLGPPLRKILESVSAEAVAPDLAAFMERHSQDVSPHFGSVSGLVFCGTPGHTVERIRREAALARQAMRIVERISARPGGDAAQVLEDVRKSLRQNPRYDWAFAPAASALAAPPKGVLSAIRKTLLAKPVTLTLLIVYALCWYTTYHLVFEIPDTWPAYLLRLGTAFVLAGLGILTTVSIALALALVWLRRIEKASEPATGSISPQALEGLQKGEDREFQNHMTAVSTLKIGRFRRLLLRLTFYLISISATHIFRPGFLSTIGTIHFARWVRIPGTDRLVFLSNYGGSWESYLEDFITKASAGLTGIWSNTEGFPSTKFLFFDGARDGDRFKRWARTQQVPTSFWYSAYPRLSTAHIRTNALIRQGISSARLSEARDWISLFSSTERQPRTRLNAVQRLLLPDPAPSESLEQGEIQSIVFGPLGRLGHGRMLAFRVPDGLDPKARRHWLASVAQKLSFGDTAPAQTAMMAFFGPDGLRRLGVGPDGADEAEALESFPLAFRQGMANPYRSRILDDSGPNDPTKWYWGGETTPVDVIVNCYADSPENLEAMVRGLDAVSREAGIPVVHRLDLSILSAEGGRGRDHFGFADGISQPVMRGSWQDTSSPVHAMHLVNPGEFLFGYRDEHGFYPPGPIVPAHSDPNGILRAVAVDGSITAGKSRWHDFGRNGTFVVMRQLQQHVDRFEGYCQAAAQNIKGLTGEDVAPDWIGARIVGRWKNGSSLVKSPHKPADGPPDNRFTFGAEDPQGLRCPLGAHVRRSNPRASLNTDLDTELRITKRHRIFRVGRTYAAEGADGATEKGLLFICVNASIERQYEFIQQTWMASGSFHGLRGEKDPLIGTQKVGANGRPRGRFALPRWEGSLALEGMPSFITTRGGGYFFLPSRSALRYMLYRLEML
jgi:Dyp-type peroxidase family